MLKKKPQIKVNEVVNSRNIDKNMNVIKEKVKINLKQIKDKP